MALKPRQVTIAAQSNWLLFILGLLTNCNYPNPRCRSDILPVKVFDPNNIQLSEAVVLSYKQSDGPSVPLYDGIDRLIESDRLASVLIDTKCTKRTIYVFQHGYPCQKIEIEENNSLDLVLPQQNSASQAQLPIVAIPTNPSPSSNVTLAISVPSEAQLPADTTVFIYQRGNYTIFPMQYDPNTIPPSYTYQFTMEAIPSRWRAIMLLPNCESALFSQEIIVEPATN